MNRRSLLSTAAASTTVALTGCLGTAAPSAEEEPHHLEVTLQNDHDRPYDGRVTVTDADGETVFDQTITLGPGEGRGFGVDYPAGEYTVSVEFADRGALQSYWNTALCDVHLVRARIDADGHQTNEVVCSNRSTTTRTG